MNIIGGTAATWGNLWITTHAAACVNAGKPCLMEECKSPSFCSVVLYNFADTTQTATVTSAQSRASGKHFRLTPPAWQLIRSGNTATFFLAATVRPRRMAIPSTLTIPQPIGLVSLLNILTLLTPFTGRQLSCRHSWLPWPRYK
jgi:hypothetical protein